MTAPSPQPRPRRLALERRVCLVAFAPHQPRSHHGRALLRRHLSASRSYRAREAVWTPAMSRRQRYFTATADQGTDYYYLVSAIVAATISERRCFRLRTRVAFPLFSVTQLVPSRGRRLVYFQDPARRGDLGIRKVSYGAQCLDVTRISCCKLTPRIAARASTPR